MQAIDKLPAAKRRKQQCPTVGSRQAQPPSSKTPSGGLS